MVLVRHQRGDVGRDERLRREAEPAPDAEPGGPAELDEIDAGVDDRDPLARDAVGREHVGDGARRSR